MAKANSSRRRPVKALYTSTNNDPAKHARRLLDTISVSGHIATALSEFVSAYNEMLPQCAVKDLEILVKGIRSVHDHASQQTSKVSVVSDLLAVYRKIQRNRADEEEPRCGRSRVSRVSPSMRRVKDFVKQCEGVRKRHRVDEDEPSKEVAHIPSPPKKKLRRSVRITVTPEKSDSNNTITDEDFSGNPLDGADEWTKMALVNFLADIDNKKILLGPKTSKTKLLKKIIESGSAPDYTGQPSAIIKLYNKWKKEGIAPSKSAGGRPPLMDLSNGRESLRLPSRHVQQ